MLKLQDTFKKISEFFSGVIIPWAREERKWAVWYLASFEVQTDAQ